MAEHHDNRISRRQLLTLASGLAAVTQLQEASADEAARGKLQIQEPVREKPQPGSVRLTNGHIVSGMCSRTNSLAPSGTDLNQKLDLRMIDQGARQLFVSSRRSEPVVVNPLDWPAITFEIRRKRISRLPLIRGQRAIGPFDAQGVARGEILQAGGRREKIDVAITRINELTVEVTSLTHDLVYQVAFDAIPRQHLFPGILELVEGFQQEPFRRPELVRMLIKGDRLPEAGRLLQSLTADFPELADEQAEYQQSIREALARQITGELERRREAGQHRLASNGARLHPKENLTPETVVRVSRMVQEYDELRQRIERVRSEMHLLVAELPDETLRMTASELATQMIGQLDENSINRLSAYELLSQAADGDARATNDELLALAGSGWLLGAESAVRSLPETLALFRMRQLIADYLLTDPAEDAHRNELLERIVALEGVNADRVAAVIRQMPSPLPIVPEAAAEGSPARFEIPSTTDHAGAIGLVPPEYRETRQYPVVIAFNANYTDPDSYLAWWQSEAARSGWIVVVPVWHPEQPVGEDPDAEGAGDPPDEAGYDASAGKHRQFLGLLRRLKLSLRIDADRVFVGGHGYGGEIAMDLATSHPDQFAGVISICGLGRRHLQWTAHNAVEVPWYVVVGDAQPEWFERMGLLAGRLFRRGDEQKLFPDVLFVKYLNRGTESYFEEADDIFQWMSLQTRERYPEVIAADVMRSTDLDWYWLRVSSIPSQFAQLDGPTTADSTGFNPIALVARRNDRNGLRIERAPGQVTVFLSPEIPDLKVDQPISITQGSVRLSVTYQPEIQHLLERLYETGDRSRLCFLKVTIPERSGRR